MPAKPGAGLTKDSDAARSNQSYDAIRWRRAASRKAHVDQLAKQVAEIALRLAAMPADGLRHNPEALDKIEQLAVQILKEVSAVRSGKQRMPGETSGMWPAMQAVRR